jgi:hypothetical protein
MSQIILVATPVAQLQSAAGILGCSGISFIAVTGGLRVQHLDARPVEVVPELVRVLSAVRHCKHPGDDTEGCCPVPESEIQLDWTGVLISYSSVGALESRTG